MRIPSTYPNYLLNCSFRPVETKEDKKPRDFKKDGKGGDRGGRGGGNGRGEGGRGGGRGHWVMPTGQAFFTGNAKSTLAAKATVGLTIPGGNSLASPIAAVKSEPSTGTNGAPRIPRPNEVIDPIIDEVVPLKNKKGKGTSVSSNSSASSQYYQDDSDDSDASRDNDGKRKKDREAEDADEAFLYEEEGNGPMNPTGIEGLEVWPPKKYDPTAPLSLPFGPKTATMRRLLANAPVLADPSDPMALINEENQSLFLIQLPNDLHMESLTRSVEQDENNGFPPSSTTTASNSSSSAPILGPDRKLGRLQLYKSGKVKLVTENGNSYDVSTLSLSLSLSLSRLTYPLYSHSIGQSWYCRMFHAMLNDSGSSTT